MKEPSQSPQGRTPEERELILEGASLLDSDNRPLSTGRAVLVRASLSGVYYPQEAPERLEDIQWWSVANLRGKPTAGDHYYILSGIDREPCSDCGDIPPHVHFSFRLPPLAAA
jgi:hypothetical protein